MGYVNVVCKYERLIAIMIGIMLAIFMLAILVYILFVKLQYFKDIFMVY